MLYFLSNAVFCSLALYGFIEILKSVYYIITYTKLKSDGIYLIVATKNQIQTGRSQRPLIVVPNQVYSKWYTDIKQLFPNVQVNDLYNFNKESVGKYVDRENPHKLNIPVNSISLCTYEALKNITFSNHRKHI